MNTEKSSTPPSRGREPPLKTMRHVKAEIARVYKDAKAGRREISDASKMVNMLGTLGRLIEGTDTIARIEALEGKAGGGR
ncbi:hypothetical protein [Roseateles sp. LYH14W]|uniref:Uncharacterized protein n=1 Tax=Pelomonas parva TaxID=3299032 RepID=A0ABW7EWU3_9BURK